MDYIMLSAAAGAAGGVWLGLFGLLVLGSLIWASETDSFLMGIAVLIIALVIGQFVFALPVWASIVTNPILLLVYVAFYTAIGAVYAAMWKVPNFVKRNKDHIQIEYKNWKDSALYKEKDRKKVSYLSKVAVGDDQPIENTKSIDVSYETFLASPYYTYSIRQNKDRVASWVLLWPFGMIWELSHKPFIWLWNSVYYSLGKVFEKINSEAAKKILEEKNK